MGTARFALSLGYILMNYHMDTGRGRLRAAEIRFWEKQKWKNKKQQIFSFTTRMPGMQFGHAR